MGRYRTFARLFAVALVAGCATPTTERDVLAQLGPPQEVRRAPHGEKVLWYPKLIESGESYAARVDANGKLIALEQRLTEENIAEIEAGASAEEVRDRLGPPLRMLFPGGVETWEYPLAGFNRPRTLYVEFSPEHVVNKLYTLERRGSAPPRERDPAR